MNEKKLVYVGFAFEHHLGTHGGYHHIKDTGIYDTIIDCQEFFSTISRSPKTIANRAMRSLSRRIIGLPCFPWFIFRMLCIGLRNKDVVFHIIYGENLYTPLFRLLPKSSKIACTFHQPFSWFDNKRWRRYLRYIDKIILVSNKEIKLFRDVTRQNNVVYIPHGVCTEFYKPDTSLAKQKIILTVGNWLRDYRFADKVFKEFLCANPEWKIVVVANPESIADITSNSKITTLSGIADEDLLGYYRQCSVLFLPLKRFTANNSLLEAASCGCNIVIASDNSDNSYIPDNFLTLVPLDKNAVVKILCNVKGNNQNDMLSKYINDNYSWRTVGENTHRYLHTK